MTFPVKLSQTYLIRVKRISYVVHIFNFDIGLVKGKLYEQLVIVCVVFNMCYNIIELTCIYKYLYE